MAKGRTRDREFTSRGYLVGRGKPPAASRFKPGTSGNPKGRPQGSVNLRTLIQRAMIAQIPVQEGARTRKVTKIEGVVLRQVQSALKGDDRAAMAVLRMAMQLGLLDEADSSSTEAHGVSAADQRIIDTPLAKRSKGRRR
jgi:Family of unknown function (DUF5681)